MLVIVGCNNTFVHSPIIRNFLNYYVNTIWSFSLIIVGDRHDPWGGLEKQFLSVISDRAILLVTNRRIILIYIVYFMYQIMLIIRYARHFRFGNAVNRDDSVNLILPNTSLFKIFLNIIIVSALKHFIYVVYSRGNRLADDQPLLAGW